ncbi:MAG: TIM barrel protein [Planctomycetota bacterium]|nr:TIM barrel protein [Planctomycetota bacterium]
MIRAGLTSVTFRKLAPREIARLAAEAGLAGIEWGGDIHVPHGDLAAAARAAALTRDAGLQVASYGSYYRVGQEEPDTFSRVLETALTLGAPIIRVWAGRLGSSQADQAHRDRVAADGRRIAGLAAERGIRIACEWHGNTLTDSAASATALFDAVGHPAFQTYWQPHQRMSCEECLRDMDAALPRLAGLHVFHWDEQRARRLPLQEGEAAWKQYLAKVVRGGPLALPSPRGGEGKTPRSSLFVLLEFVVDDSPEQMLRDAEVLRSWLAAL